MIFVVFFSFFFLFDSLYFIKENIGLRDAWKLGAEKHRQANTKLAGCLHGIWFSPDIHCEPNNEKKKYIK